MKSASPRPLEKLIREQDWIYEDAGTRWQDGLILGNGNMGVVGYAPYGLEWVLNKGDVFDGRVNRGKLMPHAKVMERFRREKLTTLSFLDQEDASPKGAISPLSKTAALLRLRFGDETSWGATRPHRAHQRLCLWEGELYYDLDLHLSHPRLRCIVPRDRNLFCVRLENAGGPLWNHLVELVRPADDDLKPASWTEGGEGIVAFEQVMPHGDARYAVAVRVVPTKNADSSDLSRRYISRRYWATDSVVGKAKCGSHHGQIPQNGNADIFVSIYTSYESRNPLEAALSDVRSAAKTGFPALERDTRAWWKRYWQKGWADFGSHKSIQRYWTFSLYETGCLLGKAPIPGLYGLWYGPTDNPGSGLRASWYTHDQNVQIPMMPIFPLNRAELVEPFIDTYLNVLPTMQKHTKETYDRPGVVAGLCMNQLGEELAAGAWRYSIHGGPYSGVILVWAWRYARDKELLRKKLYPLLREFVRFYTEAMIMGEDGLYHLDWEIPPEIHTMSRDATSTLGMLKPCLETVVEASKLLGCDATERRRWEAILAHYPAYPKNPDGGWSAGADIPPDHCVQSAYLLYPFFPGESEGTDGEATAAATLDAMAARDIEMSYADTKNRQHFKRSWAWFYPTVTALRLGRRKEGWAALFEGLRVFGKPNGLFSHNANITEDPRATEANLRRIPKGKLRHADGQYAPLSEFRCFDSGSACSLNPNLRRWVSPASEGSSAFLFASTETLLQSHGGLIRLFPGVPANFTGGFETLLAQGAVEVSARMQRGVVTECRLTAKSNSTARLLNPWRKTPRLPRGSRVEKEADHRSILEIPLRRGQTVRLQP